MLQVYYDQTLIEGRLEVPQIFEDVTILDLHLSWERFIDEYGDQYPLAYLVCSLVAHDLVTNKIHKGFPLGWG